MLRPRSPRYIYYPLAELVLRDHLVEEADICQLALQSRVHRWNKNRAVRKAAKYCHSFAVPRPGYGPLCSWIFKSQ